jgi:putative transposase
MLPHDFPPWRIVFYYYWRWRQSGQWDVIQGQLRGELPQNSRELEVLPAAG